MSFEYIDWYTRPLIRSLPKVLFVFGDNTKREGLEGQAKEARGEPNAVGIPTKWRPGNDPGAYFKNDDYVHFMFDLIKADKIITHHLRTGGKVMWPRAGIGTGYAQLDRRAPKLFRKIKELEASYRDLKPLDIF